MKLNIIEKTTTNSAGMTMNVLQVQQLEKYGEDGLSYINASLLLKKYIMKKYAGGKGKGHGKQTARIRITLY
jgi:hypothetical protein